jgi:hypothetical protein
MLRSALEARECSPRAEADEADLRAVLSRVTVPEPGKFESHLSFFGNFQRRKITYAEPKQAQSSGAENMSEQRDVQAFEESNQGGRLTPPGSVIGIAALVTAAPLALLGVIYLGLVLAGVGSGRAISLAGLVTVGISGGWGLAVAILRIDTKFFGRHQANQAKG